MTVRILIGDVREKLAELADESVHCVVTSPPYWELRDYGIDGQIGLEPTLGEHIETMVEIFREVRRVLRKDGTLWLNYGDCYATSANGRSAADTKAAGNDDRTFRDKPFSTVGPIYDQNHRPNGTNRTRGLNSGSKQTADANVPLGRIVAGGVLKSKDLCMMPARLALALQADGWWLRSEIIWAKPNPMPESIRDRPTSSHEKIYLLTKAARYFYDAEAVRTPYTESSVARLMQPGFDMQTGGPKDPKTGNRSHRKVLENIKAKRDKQRGHSRRHDGFNDRWDGMDKGEQQAMGANLRNVWNIATSPYPDAHFATFPPALVEPCIKAGTSEKGCCPECGAPWVREIEREKHPNRDMEVQRAVAAAQTGRTDGVVPGPSGMVDIVQTIGWFPSCGCKCPCEICQTTSQRCTAYQPMPCIILDPFAGSGTTGLVADRLGRDAILIELNPEYAAMADKRLHADAGMFAEVGT